MFSLPSRASDTGPDAGRDALYSAAVHICQNCGQTADRLTLVPEFDYMGCDACMAEALAVLAVEAAMPKPARIERQQGQLFPEVA